MTIVQLQLDLWQQLQQAQTEPLATDWRQLCLAFDEAISLTPVHRQLATAADAIEQMADVLAARADAWAQDWYRKPGDGPVLDEDLFAEFVRQSLSLDLSDLVDEPERYQRSASEKSHEEGESVVADVTKEVTLRLAGAEEEETPLPVAVLEHDEDVEVWVDAIRLWMHRQGIKKVELADLLNGANLPVVKCWIGVLLGEFEQHLNQTKGFYDVERVAIALPIPHPPVSAPPRAIAQAAASG
jgi:hypothetical protein